MKVLTRYIKEFLRFKSSTLVLVDDVEQQVYDLLVSDANVVVAHARLKFVPRYLSVTSATHLAECLANALARVEELALDLELEIVQFLFRRVALKRDESGGNRVSEKLE